VEDAVAFDPFADAGEKCRTFPQNDVVNERRMQTINPVVARGNHFVVLPREGLWRSNEGVVWTVYMFRLTVYN